MDKFYYQTIKQIVFDLMSTKELKGKIFIVGGTVPYLYAGIDSNRMHNDIDIIVELSDMPTIRAYLEDMNYYDKVYDSLSFSFNKDKLDYGLEVFIQDVSVNFAPFYVEGKNIIQRNFSIKELAGFDALVTVTMENIELTGYITTIMHASGVAIGCYTLEMVKCTKENSQREKDFIDLVVIQNRGIDDERYERIKPIIDNMKMDYFIPE